MVDLDPIEPEDLEWLREVLVKHLECTDSVPARRILGDWPSEQRHFVKVMPRDYKRVLLAMAEAEDNGTDVDDAIMAAAHG
jgi:glutamate synthase domain-containing protein 3